MKLRNEADVNRFLKTLDECEGGVYLVSPQGDRLDLKSFLSRCVGLGRLLDKDGDCMELFADRREDEGRLVRMLCDMDRDARLAAMA